MSFRFLLILVLLHNIANLLNDVSEGVMVGKVEMHRRWGRGMRLTGLLTYNISEMRGASSRIRMQCVIHAAEIIDAGKCDE